MGTEIKEFWEWCGFKQGLGHHRKPGYKGRLPEFTLDNLFKYAVPKLQDKGYQIDIVCFEQKNFNVAIFDVIHDGNDIHQGEGSDLTQALYKAICEVILPSKPL